MANHSTGPLITGTDLYSAVANAGYSQMSQTFAAMPQNGATAVSATLYLPPNAQIIGFNIDVTTAFDSVTSNTLSIGTAAAGTQYVSGVDVKTSGRRAPTYTATQLTNMLNVTTNTTVVATQTAVGAASAGTMTITMLYIQK